MSFKVKKIRKPKHLKYKRVAKKAVKRHAKKFKGHLRFKNVVIVISALIVLLFAIGMFKAFMFIKELSFKDVFMALLNRPVQTDEHKHTNILLLGEGGGIHDGANLTDVIMIASFDMKDYTVGILSVPRDTWIETEELGNTRVNKVLELALDEGYSEEYGISVLEEELEEMLDIPHVAAKDN